METSEIAGFYTLAATGVALESLSPDVAKKLPRYPVIPAALLGRLAVDRGYQGKGQSSVLLSDASIRTSLAEFGIFALVVHAKDEAASRFYERYGFTSLPGDDLRLYLPIATALRKLERKH